MAQTLLPVIQIDQEKKISLDQHVDTIYSNIKDKFVNFAKFHDVLFEESSYTNVDLKDNQRPEEFTKENMIEPIFDFLGYERVGETTLLTPAGNRDPDYVIRPKENDDTIFYVEAEPLNTDLSSRNHGVAQVREWLISRASQTDYAIATNGFEWILLKYDAASVGIKPILKIDLRPLFSKKLEPTISVNDKEIEKEKLLLLHGEYISQLIGEYSILIEEKKEELSKRFYNDYVRYVFGYDNDGNAVDGVCLRNKIIVPTSVTEDSRNLFSVVFMNRLIFIKFLEDRKIVPTNLLEDLQRKYSSSLEGCESNECDCRMNLKVCSTNLLGK